MKRSFQTIAVMSRQRHQEDAEQILKNLIDYLIEKGLKIVLEEETAAFGNYRCTSVYSADELGKHCDLIIIVGGDGGLLQAAQAAVRFDKPILGINRGYLGFLADIRPDEIRARLDKILDGQYREENRFLLNAFVDREPPLIASALNDVVLLPGKIAHLIEFDIFINEQFVCHQRADGLIVATPTGSTAYALSGGGPILHPDLDAIVLVPMFPHTLSSRPIVVSGQSEVVLHISSTSLSPQLSCDGQANIELSSGDIIKIRKRAEQLRLIHPLDYDYFDTLRVKLYWERKC